MAIALPLSIMRPSPPQIGRAWLRHAIAWKRFYRTSILLNFFEPITGLVSLGVGLGHYVGHIEGVKFIQFIGPGLGIPSVADACKARRGAMTGSSGWMDDPLHEKVLMLLLEAPHVGGLRSSWSPSREVKYA
jgi:hypothetical protein